MKRPKSFINLLLAWLLGGLTCVVAGGERDASDRPTGNTPPLNDSRTPPTSNPAKPEKTFTQKSLFSIPFFLNPRAKQPSVVRLYVSNDEGQHWSMYQERSAREMRFDFQASEDGEFWFVVRTNFDGDVPENGCRAEKVVVVDRETPQIQLEAVRQPDGAIQANWQIQDANLEPNTLQLEYRTSPDAAWEPVPVARRFNHSGGSTTAAPYTDQTHWSPSTSNGPVQVRLRVFDRALNEATQSVSIEPRSATEPPGATAVDATDDWQHRAEESSPPPLADETRSGDHDSRHTWSSSRVPKWPQGIDAKGSPWPPAADRSVQDASNDDADPPQREQQVHENWRSDRQWQEEPEVDPSRRDRSPPDASSENQPDDESAEKQSATSGHEDAAPATTTHPTSVGSGDHSADTTEEATAATSVEPAATSAPPEPVWFSAKRFNLDYEVTDAQSSKIMRVELWITDDSGRNWRVWGQDTDLVSPMTVDGLPEGTHGFRLLVTSESGNALPIPQPGDVPELVVNVDRTKPVITIESSQIVETSRGPQLEVRWSTTEAEQLVVTPIEISIAPAPDGPWQLIRSKLENTGEFKWLGTERLPHKVYVRVDATDQAGNTGTAVSQNPVGANDGPPKAIIRRILPIRGDGR